MRLLFSPFLLLLFISCSVDSPPPLIAKAEIRYLEDQRELRGELSLWRGDSLPGSLVFRPPAGTVSFLGSAMQADELADRQRWRAQMKVDYPEEMRFNFPLTDDYDASRTTVGVRLSAPSTDSLPTVIDRSKRLRFAAGKTALAADENIVVFFEPEDRGQRPRRIVVAGPSATEKITLPAASLTDIPPGRHGVYLVKQKLARDTVDGVMAATQLAYHTRTKAVVVE